MERRELHEDRQPRGYYHPSRNTDYFSREWLGEFDLHRLEHAHHRISRAQTSRTPEEIEALRLKERPCQAVKFFGLLPYSFENPVIRCLLQGTRQQDTFTPLTRLREHESTLLPLICSFLGNAYADHVRLTLPADLIGNGVHYRTVFLRFIGSRNRNRGQGRLTHSTLVNPSKFPCVSRHGTDSQQDGFVSFAKVGQVDDLFPPPANRNVNMMPFLLGVKSSLPDGLQCYFQMIDACPYYIQDVGKVAYLTIQESHVVAGATQRRPGLHIESPGVFSDPPVAENNRNQDNGDIPLEVSFTPGEEHDWGNGAFRGPDRFEGGIYVASNVDATTELYDALVDRTIPGIVDHHGGCKHLRNLIGPGTKVSAGELVWMTDCTPHKSLPQSQDGIRQFFRLVMPPVSHVYANHSTVNPRVALPRHVKVIHGSKFEPRQQTLELQANHNQSAIIYESEASKQKLKAKQEAAEQKRTAMKRKMATLFGEEDSSSDESSLSEQELDASHTKQGGD